MRKDLFVVFLVVMALIFINAASVVQLKNPTFTAYTTTALTVSSITATAHTWNANTLSAFWRQSLGETIWISSATNVGFNIGWPIFNGGSESVNGENDRPSGTVYLKINPGAVGTGTMYILERIK